MANQKISLSAPVYDPNGSAMLTLRPGAMDQVQGGSRRQTKTATLDSGALLYDTGYAPTDRVWNVEVENTESTRLFVEYLARNYQKIRVSVAGVLVLASIRSWNVAGADIRMALSVLEEL